MSIFTNFLQWYHNKNIDRTLEAMQKLIEFYHDKRIDMFKLSCTLPKLSNICLHKSTDYMFYPFFSSDRQLLEKIPQDMTGSPSIVFTGKALANETFIRKPNNLLVNQSLALMPVNSSFIP